MIPLETAIRAAMAVRDAAPKGKWTRQGPSIYAPEDDDYPGGRLACVDGNKYWKPRIARLLVEARNHVDLLEQALVRIEYYETVLNTIASWDEGATVSGSFDEPYAAEIARGALCSDEAVKELERELARGRGSDG